MYWLKIWVRSQLRWEWNCLKLNVTSLNVLRIIIHWLSASRDVGLTQGSLIPKEHSLYRALKHCICQHKLDLNLSKTKQPLMTKCLCTAFCNFKFIIQHFERRAHSWNVFEYLKRNCVSLHGHVISSIYSSSKLKAKVEGISTYHEVVRSHFVK